jgi:hypothetical protein
MAKIRQEWHLIAGSIRLFDKRELLIKLLDIDCHIVEKIRFLIPVKAI